MCQTSAGRILPSTPEIRAVLSHDPASHDEQTTPRDDASIVKIIVADDGERGLMAALPVRVVHLPRLGEGTQRVLAVFQPHRHRLVPLRAPEKIEILALATTFIQLGHGTEKAVGGFGADGRILRHAGRSKSRGLAPGQFAKREKFGLAKLESGIERRRQRGRFFELAKIVRLPGKARVRGTRDGQKQDRHWKRTDFHRASKRGSANGVNATTAWLPCFSLSFPRVTISVLEVRYERGVYLPAQDLWLDPHEAKPLAFVSHAHSDHIAPHQEIIVSERTARLMQARMPGERREHILPFEQPTKLRGLNITLLPAGHIFGSAQFFLEADAGTLLYTGDFKLRPSRSAEPTKWRTAETLIMETTFGLPRYRFPATEEVIAQIVAFCREAIDDKAVPVLLGYSLGKAQEILCSLAGAGLQPMLHGSVYRMTRIYEQFGQPCGAYERYDAKNLADKVLICPPSANRSRMLEKIPNKRVAMISGWAVDPNARFRYQTDAAFPLSDHADYTDLLRYVELVQPKRVLTLHGFAAEFARDLRERGIEAWALSEENQLELKLSVTQRPAVAAPRTAETAAVESEFDRFAEVGDAIAATPEKLEKVRLLADYLRPLGKTRLPIAARYLTGSGYFQP